MTLCVRPRRDKRTEEELYVSLSVRCVCKGREIEEREMSKTRREHASHTRSSSTVGIAAASAAMATPDEGNEREGE